MDTPSATTFDWTAVAPSWDRLREHTARIGEPVAAAMLASLQLAPGDSVLELACGTGELALKLSEIVAPDGRVVATDAAAGMVEIAAKTLSETGNATASHADASDIGLPTASFDAVACSMGLMFVLDPTQALQECRRVLVPGGRLAAAVWGAPQNNPWVSSVGMAAMMQGLVAGGPPTGPGGIFSLSDPGDLQRHAVAAGFQDIVVTEVPITLRFSGVDDYFDHVSSLAGPLAAVLNTATPEARLAVRATVGDLVSGFLTDDGLTLPGLALVLTGRA